jgi:hypothetical protein
MGGFLSPAQDEEPVLRNLRAQCEETLQRQVAVIPGELAGVRPWFGRGVQSADGAARNRARSREPPLARDVLKRGAWSHSSNPPRSSASMQSGSMSSA